MAARIRAHDWSTTPLGPIRTWPESLKTAIDLILAADEAEAAAGLPADGTAPLRAARAGQTEAMSRRHERWQAFRLDLSHALRSIAEPGEMERTVTRLLGQVLGADRVFYASIDDAGAAWSVRQDHADGVPHKAGTFPMSDVQRRRLPRWQAGEISSIDDSETDPSLDASDRAACAAFGARAAIGVPLIRDGRLTALLAVSQVEPRVWSDAELELARETAERTWDALERLRIGAALQASEERQRLMIELVPALLWQADPAGREISVNERWRLYTGQSAAETQDYGWLHAIHPEDRPAAQAAFEHAFATGEPLERRQRIRRQDGEHRWHLVWHLPVRDEAGHITRWLGAAFDIHESKLAEQALDESERRLQMLVEGVPQLVWRAVNGGAWTWASPQWTEYTGQSAAESRGRGWLEPVHPDDREGVAAIWDRAVERGEFRADYRIRHAVEDRYRWFQTRATPVRDGEGRIVEWLGTSTDVDDLRQLQERQHVLVSELQHRTFNLMGMVRAMADATVRSSASLEEFKPKFRDRIDALARVQRLLSRLGEDDRVTFDELIRGEFEAVGALPDDDARVTLTGPHGVALRSSTVQTFAMAVHELTTNAVKYGALGQPGAHLAVEWHVAAGDEDEPWLHVSWQESGVAMPPADAAPRGTGQGRSLIEAALPYQLHARTTYVITPDGIRCTIALPVSARTRVEGRGTPRLP